jgi:hypothetical protein
MDLIPRVPIIFPGRHIRTMNLVMRMGMKIILQVPLLDYNNDTDVALAVTCLERLFQIYPIEESLQSVVIVSRLLSQASLGSIRTGLIIVCVLFAVLGAEMQTYLSQVTRFFLPLTTLDFSRCTSICSASYPSVCCIFFNLSVSRIRICAFMCLQSIILSSISVGYDKDADSESPQGAPLFFRECGPYLSIAMSALTVGEPSTSL